MTRNKFDILWYVFGFILMAIGVVSLVLLPGRAAGLADYNQGLKEQMRATSTTEASKNALPAFERSMDVVGSSAVIVTLTQSILFVVAGLLVIVSTAGFSRIKRLRAASHKHGR